MSCYWRCKWKAISVSRGVYVLDVIKGGAGTTILYVCAKCGATKTKTINGHWTLDEVRGES